MRHVWLLQIQLIQSCAGEFKNRKKKTARNKHLNKKGKHRAGLEVIKLEYNLKLKIKHNDWLLVDTCPQAANHCALF